MSRGTARPKPQQNVHADSVLRTPHTVARSRPEVLIRKLAGAQPYERPIILKMLRDNGSPKALAAAAELERRWAEVPRRTRVSGKWRVTPVVLTERARPKATTRDGSREATQDGFQWRVSFNGTFMGYVLTEDRLREMLGDSYEDLEEVP